MIGRICLLLLLQKGGGSQHMARGNRLLLEGGGNQHMARGSRLAHYPWPVVSGWSEDTIPMARGSRLARRHHTHVQG